MFVSHLMVNITERSRFFCLFSECGFYSSFMQWNWTINSYIRTLFHGDIISCYTLILVRWWQTDHVMVKNDKKKTYNSIQNMTYKRKDWASETHKKKPEGDDVSWQLLLWKFYFESVKDIFLYMSHPIFVVMYLNERSPI